MTDADDDKLTMADFLPPSPQPVSLPQPDVSANLRLVHDDVDDGSSCGADFLPDNPLPVQLDPNNIDGCRRALRTKFPEADSEYLEQVLASSEQHIGAMLKDKLDARVDKLIHRFLKQRGRITSHQRYEVKGNGVDWTYLRDTGLITRKIADSNAGGYIYELRLDAFDLNRGVRDALAEKDRRALFTLHGNRCNFCGSAFDLQADHRVSVCLVGGSSEGLTAYQAACRLCNLNKRVTCREICLVNTDPENCKSCYWAYPERHTHVAGESGSRVTLRLKSIEARDEVRELLEAHGLLAV